eukprot:3338335-Pleurochrysis_carterae.AAC.1
MWHRLATNHCGQRSNSTTCFNQPTQRSLHQLGFAEKKHGQRGCGEGMAARIEGGEGVFTVFAAAGARSGLAKRTSAKRMHNAAMSSWEGVGRASHSVGQAAALD